MKLSYQDQLKRKLRAAVRRGDEDAAAYYAENMSGVACVSWERFRGSWAGQQWLKKRRANS